MTLPGAETEPGGVLIVATEDWFLALHWIPLIKAALATGRRVVVATRIGRHADVLTATGAEVVPLGLARESRNPLRELVAIRELQTLYRRFRPEVIHHIAMKPILYGAWAARSVAPVRVIHTFPGLGHLYVSDGFGTRLGRGLLQGILRPLFRDDRVVVQVQNLDDAATLTGAGVVPASRVQNIGGVGVDLSRFAMHPEDLTRPATVVFPARMLIDKGVLHFVAAARLLRQRGSTARFLLAGDTDSANPAAVPAEDLQAWAEEGVVEWLGHRDDMPALFREATLIVLPSFYREGVPKSLQEAAACGRAIVTTDVPGCRDVVRHSWNGLLVPPRDTIALAEAIAQLLADEAGRQQMGSRGRKIAEEIFDDRIQAAGMISRYPAIRPTPPSPAGRGQASVA